MLNNKKIQFLSSPEKNCFCRYEVELEKRRYTNVLIEKTLSGIGNNIDYLLLLY